MDDDSKKALIDAIITAYHTTRLRDCPVAEHILSKTVVQRAFDDLMKKSPDTE